MERCVCVGFVCVLLMIGSVGCVELEAVSPEAVSPEEVSPEEGPARSEREIGNAGASASDLSLAHRPFHVSVFDHAPTDEEVRADLARYATTLAGDAGPLSLVNPHGPIVPIIGQKLVQIRAATSNLRDAGTDAANHIRFVGVWQAPSLQQFSESFVLDNPVTNDLNRNTVSVFHYLLNVAQHVPGLTQDRFVKGWLTTSTSDGWHCNYLVVSEQEYRGGTRIQSLPFNQWVDYPSIPVSNEIVANDPSWLSYY